MKKGLIIGGGVLVAGVIAYFIFKKKPSTEVASTNPPQGNVSDGATNSGSSVTPTLSAGEIITNETKAPTIQEQQNLDKANDIVVKIKDYYKKSVSAQIRVSMFQPSTFNPVFTKPSNPYPIMISKLKNELLKLGYEYKGEKDGILVKI